MREKYAGYFHYGLPHNRKHFGSPRQQQKPAQISEICTKITV